MYTDTEFLVIYDIFNNLYLNYTHIQPEALIDLMDFARSILQVFCGFWIFWIFYLTELYMDFYINV